MGKFQLNKKGEDPIKIYEDVFKIAEGTVETHLDKLGKQPKPIARNQLQENQMIHPDLKQILKTINLYKNYPLIKEVLM